MKMYAVTSNVIVYARTFTQHPLQSFKGSLLIIALLFNYILNLKDTVPEFQETSAEVHM